MTELSPIVMFVYNRANHTLRALQSLQLNKLASDSVLYIYADGPKSNSTAEDLLKIEKTRAVIKQQQWCKKVIITKSDTNKGLAHSVITGVTEVINKHGKVIVLEDDLLLSKYFLEYMNESLNIFEKHDNIYSVNGYMFPIEFKHKTTFLLPYTSSWGWATWKKKWEAFKKIIPEQDKKILLENPFIKSRFNLADYNYTNMLNLKNKSWAINWHYSVFIKNGLNVFPTVSLVNNVGFDGSGTNCNNEGSSTYFDDENKVIINPENNLNLNYFNSYLLHFKSPKNSFIKSKLKKFFLVNRK